jgi:hypothetical protein
METGWAPLLRRVDDAIDERIIVTEISMAKQRELAIVSANRPNGVRNRMMRVVAVKRVANSDFAGSQLDLKRHRSVVAAAIIEDLED